MIQKIFLDKMDDQRRGFFAQYPIEEAAWIWHPDTCPDEPDFLKFTLRFVTSETDGPMRFHLSADQYYKLFIDGGPVCKGPESSDVSHWSFSSFEWTDIPPGGHELVVFVWNAGKKAPLSRMSYRGGFIFSAEGACAERMNTGISPWRVEKLDIEISPYENCSWQFYAAGYESRWTGGGFAAERETVSPAIVQDVISPALHGERREGWFFRPAVLPELTAGRAAPGRFIAVKPDEPDAQGIVFDQKHADPGQLVEWNGLLAGQSVTVLPHSEIALLWDMEEYYCGFSELKTEGGCGAEITWRWMESLYDNEPGYEKEKCERTKSHRDEWAGKLAHGVGDIFCPDGGLDYYFSYWWRAGRFCLIKIKTTEEALTIRSLNIEENLYPLNEESSVQLDIPGSGALARICKRGLRATLQDQYCDSPYYEQTQYVGDSRIEALLTYVMSRDDRVPRRMMDHFDWSRTRFNGITSCRYPATKDAIIETFSLIYILILHDALFWRPQDGFIRDKRPAVHKIIDSFLRKKNSQGLSCDFIFPYIDAGTYYPRGLAPDSQNTASSPVNLFLLLALQKAAEIEDAVGLPGTRDYFSAEAHTLGESIRSVFYCPDRGVFADDPTHLHFSQHAQSLAVLTGLLKGDEARQTMELSLTDTSFNATSLYFRFYFIQALFRCGLESRFAGSIQDWQSMVDLGLKATAEHPDLRTTRSDCHAWSAHPYFFFLTEIAGIQPATPGFQSIRIRPRWTGCRTIQARMPHPAGSIRMDVELTATTCRGHIELPEGTSGTFEYGQCHIPLKSGQNILT